MSFVYNSGVQAAAVEVGGHIPHPETVDGVDWWQLLDFYDELLSLDVVGDALHDGEDWLSEHWEGDFHDDEREEERADRVHELPVGVEVDQSRREQHTDWVDQIA